MKKYIITLLFLSLSAIAYTQVSDSLLTKSEFYPKFSKLSAKLISLEKVNTDLQQKNAVQKKQMDSIIFQLSIARSNIRQVQNSFHIAAKNVSSLRKKMGSINSQLSVAQSNIQQISDSLHITIKNASTTNEKTQNQIQNIHQIITNRTLYWIIGILAVALLSVIIFFVLRNKLSLSTRSLDSQITKTNDTLQNEALKLDSKLVEILQTQLNILKEERKTKSLNADEPMHKLPLKVGDEIHRMRKRIGNMPQDVKGLSALKNSLQRLEEEFNENGYTIEDLLNKKYVDGMKVEARFVDNPDIPKGEEIITEVLRPEIKYKGVVIRVAKIEVGKSY